MARGDKKTAILDVAMKCIQKYGIEATNTHSIARELGIAQSGVFYHFKNQQELFDSLLLRIIEVNSAHLAKLRGTFAPKDLHEELYLYLRGNLEWAHANPDQVAVLLYSFLKTSSSAHMRRIVNKALGTGEKKVRAFLKEGDDETAKFIHQALVGTIVAQYYAQPKEALSVVIQRLGTQVRRLLEGQKPIEQSVKHRKDEGPDNRRKPALDVEVP